MCGSMVSFGFNKESAFLGSSCYSSLEAFQNKYGTTVYYIHQLEIFSKKKNGFWQVYYFSLNYKLYFFVYPGPDHTSMYIRPRPGVSLEVWSLTRVKPEPAHMPPDVQETTYFVYYSYGGKPDTPWSFSLYFKVIHQPADYTL